jgi:hypothetical protein
MKRVKLSRFVGTACALVHESAKYRWRMSTEAGGMIA